MRFVPILLLIGFYVVLIQSRPSKTDENNESGSEDAEYGGEDRAGADDSLEALIKQNEDASERDMGQSGRMDVKKNVYSYEQRNLAKSRADRSHSDISDYKPHGNGDVRNDKAEEPNNYEDIQNYAKRRPSKYIENKDTADQQEAAQHLTNRNVNYYKNNRIHNNILLEDPLSKRETGLKETPTEQGEMFFETQDKASQVDKNDFSNEPLELNQRFSKYHTQMNPENKELIQCKSRESDIYVNRDRRETKDSVDIVSKIDQADKELDKNQNEDEEMAIKRHIKKLSSDELEELLSSLSEEKRQLLQTIIDDTDLTVNDSVNKREITKKAGAVEENTCVESGPVDSGIHSDITAVDASTEAPAQSSDATEASKQTDNQSENTDSSNSKSTDTSSGNKAGLINQNQDAVQQKSDAEASNIGAEKTHAEIVPSEQVTTKTENKRETNLDDLADIVSFEDPKMTENDWLSEDSKDCSQNEDLSQFLDDEQAMADDGSKVYKRDVEKQADYDAKIKSLEESFPKSTNYDDSSGPLIRMKRTNEPVIKKRSAAVLPDAKVAFFPYRAENEDEDTDEGNEFDDDGFYDRSPNFSNKDANELTAIRDASSCKLNDGNRRASPNDNFSKGTMSLGSDTDSVLSGVEGADENLMFSSGSRNRRTTEDVSDVLDETNSIHNSKSLIDETKAVSDMNALTYQESDSFGPLPRNNEGDSGRFKRIRRVKQSHPEGTSCDS